MIVENEYTEQLADIFDSNHQIYLSDRNVTKRGFLNIVYVENSVPLGYAAVYPKKDFCEQEGYPAMEDIKENSIYIWQMATKKGFENRGIGAKIVKYITEKFRDRDIYSSIDVTNIGSRKVHEKCGFVVISSFSKQQKGENRHFQIVLREAQKNEN